MSTHLIGLSSFNLFEDPKYIEVDEDEMVMTGCPCLVACYSKRYRTWPEFAITRKI